MFEMRTSKPTNNKFYMTTSKGGYSTCIQGYPTDASCNVLANCVGYACGRFNEIIGSMKYPSLNCNAENFIERAKSLGLEISDVPTMGGIMVWANGQIANSSDGAGHVAVVENIVNSNSIVTSESAYKGQAFFTRTRSNDGRWGASAGYTYRGCIVNPSVGKVTTGRTGGTVASTNAVKVFGVDLSQWQKGISIAKVKAEGAKFAILRAGYTGYGNGVSKVKDECFENFYSQCKAQGLGVGAYWYSCATTYDHGKAEAEYMYTNCLKGKSFEYPIAIDVEDTHHQAPAGKSAVTNAIKGFCEYLEAKGYYVAIYSSSSWFTSRMNVNDLTAYDKWVANWSASKPSTPTAGLWQFGGSTNKLRSTNIAGMTVDQNYAYYDYPGIMKSKGLNGFKADGSSTPTTPGKSVDELANEVLAGLWGNGDDRKSRLTSAGYDYSAVQARVNELMGDSKKSVDEIAKEVVAGAWGNGEDRKTRLTQAGYNYSEVQAKVNALMGASTKKSTTDIAREVIAGKWGNGATRKQKLTQAGYNYATIQAEVNRLMK